MADYNQAGGRQFDRPDYSDAVPPTPVRQGDAGTDAMGHNRVDEHTFESGQAPDARSPIESDWMGLVGTDGLDGRDSNMGSVANQLGEGILGFRTNPVGGTYNPGQGKTLGSPGVERSPASVRSDY